MTENMKMFLEIASKNEELREKLNKMDEKALIAAAKELGIELTEADFTPPTGEVSDDELDVVAGGAYCLCIVGGGGSADSNDNVCACVAYGSGTSRTWPGKRCSCPLAGDGSDS